MTYMSKDKPLNEAEFGPNTEKAIVSLMFDKPEFFTSIIQNISHKFFKVLEAQYIIGVVETLYQQHNVVPTRQIVKDYALKQLTTEDDYEPIIKLIDRPSDPREVPFIKGELLKWARERAFGLLYSEDGIDAYESGDYDKLEEIFEEAKKITDVSDDGIAFFDSPEMLFMKDLEKRYTTGFPKLDQYLNEGGPTKKELVCFMAGTGGGKCHTLGTKIWEHRLSMIYEIEVETKDGFKIIRAAGFREVKTSRGIIKVCDLTVADDIAELQIVQDSGDLQL